MKNVACKGELWGKCAALGDALRRASEAETRIKELEVRLIDTGIQLREALLREEMQPTEPRRVLSIPGHPEYGVCPALIDLDDEGLAAPPPQLSGCPKCGSDMSTTRSLKKEETERGMRVCTRCFTRYER